MPEEMSDPGMLSAMVDELLADPDPIGIGHLDELEAGAGRQCLRLERLLPRMPPGHAAARLDRDLASDPGKGDLGGIAHRERIGLLDENTREPDVDREDLARLSSVNEDRSADERYAQGP
jgi:hypothetical protein